MQGLAWATERVFATAALLVEEPAGMVAFDYLVDYLQRQDQPIPAQMWEAALTQAIDSDELLRVATAAAAAGQHQTAEQALRRVATTDTNAAMSAAYALGVLLQQRGQAGDAEPWFQRAAAAGQADAAYALGQLLQQRGQAREAERWYRQAAAAGSANAAYALGAAAK